MLFCRRLGDDIYARKEHKSGDPQLRCRTFDRPYLSHYSMHCGLHRTQMVEAEVHRQTAVQNPSSTSQHYLRLFSVAPRERHHCSVAVSPSWQVLETHFVLCVSTSLMFALSSGVFGNGEQQFSRLVRDTTTTEITFMFFDCFIWAAKLAVLDFFLTS